MGFSTCFRVDGLFDFCFHWIEFHFMQKNICGIIKLLNHKIGENNIQIA